MHLSKTRAYIIDEFMKSLDEERLPWHKPWNSDTRVPFFGENYSTKKAYRGVNVFALEIAALSRGYTSNEWLTFNQMKKLGYHFEQDEKGNTLAKGQGVPIEVYKPWDSETHKELSFDEYRKIMNGSDEDRKKNLHIIIKNYTVFNGDLITEIVKEEKKIISTTNIKLPETASAVLMDYSTNEGILINEEIHNDSAYYDSSKDTVIIPAREKFETPEAFVSVLGHELTHSTGHEKRLNRDINNVFGSKEYAKEELIAEIGTAFLSASLGVEITDYQINNSKAYVQGWISIINNKPDVLFNAIVNAEKASNFIKEKGNFAKYLEEEKELINYKMKEIHTRRK